MSPSTRRDRKTKALAEMLAMMVESHPQSAIRRSTPADETDEGIWEAVTEFCTALDCYAGRAKNIKRASH